MNNTTKIVSAIIAIAIIVGIGFLFSKNSTEQNTQIPRETVYDKIIESGKIKVGYISYPPSFIKDPNTGEYSGIFHEVLQEIGKKLDVKIDYTEEVGWGTMIEAISSGRVDLIATGVWPTTERGKHVDFTNPLYYSTVKTYVRVNDSRFDGDLSKINNSNIKISSIDGEMTSIIAQLDYPKAKQESLTQMSDVSQVLLNVATGKADVTFAEPAIALEYMAMNPGRIKEVKSVKPVRVFPNAMIVGKGEIELLSTLNIAVDELINNGFVNRVIEKYEKYPGSFQKVDLPFREN